MKPPSWQRYGATDPAVCRWPLLIRLLMVMLIISAVAAAAWIFLSRETRLSESCPVRIQFCEPAE